MSNPADIITTDYKIGLKREVVTALKSVFDQNFPWPELRDNLYVGLDYPETEVMYPAIYITYTERMLRNAGISHEERMVVDGIEQRIKRWIFEGDLNFNVIALSPLDRDRVSAALINTLAFSEIIPDLHSFWEEIYDADYVAIQPLLDNLIPGGERVGAVPWGNEDEQQYGNSYSIKVFGEFLSNPSTSELIQISGVDVYPYREEEQPPPW